MSVSLSVLLILATLKFRMSNKTIAMSVMKAAKRAQAQLPISVSLVGLASITPLKTVQRANALLAIAVAKLVRELPTTVPLVSINYMKIPALMRVLIPITAIIMLHYSLSNVLCVIQCAKPATNHPIIALHVMMASFIEMILVCHVILIV